MGTINCPNCNHELPYNAEFCSNCGSMINNDYQASNQSAKNAVELIETWQQEKFIYKYLALHNGPWISPILFTLWCSIMLIVSVVTKSNSSELTYSVFDIRLFVIFLVLLENFLQIASTSILVRHHKFSEWSRSKNINLKSSIQSTFDINFDLLSRKEKAKHMTFTNSCISSDLYEKNASFRNKVSVFCILKTIINSIGATFIYGSIHSAAFKVINEYILLNQSISPKDMVIFIFKDTWYIFVAFFAICTVLSIICGNYEKKERLKWVNENLPEYAQWYSTQRKNK